MSNAAVTTRQRPPARTERDLSRLYAALIAVVCLAILLVGAGLTPSNAGHGTHEQLGLPACAFAQTLGRPCATCGMTTAVTHAANGNLARGAVVQPFGAGIALAAATGFWIALHVTLTGSRLWRLASPLLTTRPLLLLAALLLAAWVYKILVWNPS